MDGYPHPLHAALVDIRRRSGGPGCVAYLSWMGSALRKSGIDLSSFPQRSLSSLLETMPAFCELVDKDRVRFLDGEPVVPEGSPGEEAWVLRQDLWDAMVRNVAGRGFYLDLDDLEIIEVDLVDEQPGQPVAAEPMRYLKVPTIPTAEQAAMARDFLADKVDIDSLNEIFADPGSWFRKAAKLLAPDLWSALQVRRKALVLDLARRFLSEHAIEHGRYLRHQERPASAPRPRSDEPARRGVPGQPTEARLRARLHEVLEAMTLAELLELRVPARFTLPDT